VVPFALLAPAVGVLASAWVYGESFGPIQVAGMACMLMGLAIVVLPRKTARVVE
jgi:O-acetylserine/cysteine efflux transporter